MIKPKTLRLGGLILGLIVILVSFIFLNESSFFLIFGTGIIIIVAPYIIGIILENALDSEKEEMFIEFSRSLVEGVKTGTPISKTIINMRNKSFGVLTPHVQKLSNQIQVGIPLSTALNTFARDLDNKTVSRAITLIGQAERAGGDIGEILEAVAGAIATSDKLKKERKAAISTLIVQGYIIFLVFLGIILIMQFKIIPMVAGISQIGGASSGLSQDGVTIATNTVDTKSITNSFFYLILVQGFFSGLAIGKLAEGNIKAGIKHSFALVLISFFVSSIAKIFFGI